MRRVSAALQCSAPTLHQLPSARPALQVWRTRWPANAGSAMLWTAPMVHKGFIDCYRANE